MSARTCEVKTCERPMHARGYCTMHVRRWRNTGDPEGKRKPGPPFQDPAARFWAKVDKTGACWEWTGTKTYDGYGKFWLNGSDMGAHRWSFEQACGPIPEGLQIDHLCRVRHCVNPEHMEVVTVQENLRRRDLARSAR